MAFPPSKPHYSLASRSDGPAKGRSRHHTARQALSTYWVFPSRDIGHRLKMPGHPECRSCGVALCRWDFAQTDNDAAPAQDGPASGQSFRRIAFMSKSATPHQNLRFGFETVKNARADVPAHPDSFPARVGFFKS